jgi:uncharacterized protein with PIN domain
MEDPSIILLKGRLDSKQRNRLTRLLDMMYTPSELAEEVGFYRRQVYRVYIPAGCPQERDLNKRIWINGKAFREWALQIYKKVELTFDETFCLTCRRAVKIINPERKKEGRLVYDVSICPECGRKLAKIIDKEKRDQ